MKNRFCQNWAISLQNRKLILAESKLTIRIKTESALFWPHFILFSLEIIVEQFVGQVEPVENVVSFWILYVRQLEGLVQQGREGLLSMVGESSAVAVLIPLYSAALEVPSNRE
jgi:hypothetical protein